jgi:hypothetical protein
LPVVCCVETFFFHHHHLLEESGKKTITKICVKPEKECRRELDRIYIQQIVLYLFGSVSTLWGNAQNPDSRDK